MHCVECGRKIMPNNRFCASCGIPIVNDYPEKPDSVSQRSSSSQNKLIKKTNKSLWMIILVFLIVIMFAIFNAIPSIPKESSNDTLDTQDQNTYNDNSDLLGKWVERSGSWIDFEFWNDGSFYCYDNGDYFEGGKYQIVDDLLILSWSAFTDGGYHHIPYEFSIIRDTLTLYNDWEGPIVYDKSQSSNASDNMFTGTPPSSSSSTVVTGRWVDDYNNYIDITLNHDKTFSLVEYYGINDFSDFEGSYIATDRLIILFYSRDGYSIFDVWEYRMSSGKMTISIQESYSEDIILTKK